MNQRRTDPQPELFEVQQTRHAGSSPYQRFKASKRDDQPLKIGWLTATVPIDVYVRLVMFAQNNDDWRSRLVEAIDEVCSV